MKGSGANLMGSNVSISLWVNFNSIINYKVVTMTGIQGHNKIGGILVASSSKQNLIEEFQIGGFDEKTGKFVKYGIKISKERRDWHHLLLIITNYGLEK